MYPIRYRYYTQAYIIHNTYFKPFLLGTKATMGMNHGSFTANYISSMCKYDVRRRFTFGIWLRHTGKFVRCKCTEKFECSCPRVGKEDQYCTQWPSFTMSNFFVYSTYIYVLRIPQYHPNPNPSS